MCINTIQKQVIMNINNQDTFLQFYYARNVIYASKKKESQVDMKEAKRMTLFIIMINISRNGINAIMKNDPIKYLLKTRRTYGLQSPPPSLCFKSACTPSTVCPIPSQMGFAANWKMSS